MMVRKGMMGRISQCTNRFI